LIALRTSFTVERPSLPVPSTSARSMPRSSAMRPARVLRAGPRNRSRN